MPDKRLAQAFARAARQKKVVIKEELKAVLDPLEEEMFGGPVDGIDRPKPRKPKKIRVGYPDPFIENIYMAIKDFKVKHPIANLQGKRITEISGDHLVQVIRGERGSVPCFSNGRRRTELSINILIAYDGKYILLAEIKDMYDDDFGDYPIEEFLHDRAEEAYRKVVPRKNTDTNKDKWLSSLTSAYGEPVVDCKRDANGRFM